MTAPLYEWDDDDGDSFARELEAVEADPDNTQLEDFLNRASWAKERG